MNDEAVSHMFLKDPAPKHSEVDSVKILGLKWVKTEDCFAYDGIDVPCDIVTTKCAILSFLERLFDPLGFLNPFVMVA